MQVQHTYKLQKEQALIEAATILAKGQLLMEAPIDGSRWRPGKRAMDSDGGLESELRTLQGSTRRPANHVQAVEHLNHVNDASKQSQGRPAARLVLGGPFGSTEGTGSRF